MKRILRISILSLVVGLLPLLAFGQSAKSLRINEVLVVNKTNFMDNYGVRSPWVEIFNTSPATVDIGGCFLTNDKNNPTKYPIPRGDVQTRIKPRQHVLFWLDDKAIHGTYHLNFTVDPSKENYIALFDADGKTLIDEVTIPAGQKADESYAREVDGVLPWIQTVRVTPSTNNKTLDSNEKLDFFRDNDPYGIVVTVISMMVVFLSLLLLYIIFKIIGKNAVRMVKRKAAKGGASMEAVNAAIDVPGDVYAVIGLALHEVYSSVHDDESTVITIRNIRKKYSPWSSKIHTLRQIPRR